VRRRQQRAIAAAAAVLAFRLIAERRAEVQQRSFDLPGAATVTAGLTAAVYAIVEAESCGWTSTRIPAAHRVRGRT
jgi:hypothetical protein